jgi:hypothetical protein
MNLVCDPIDFIRQILQMAMRKGAGCAMFEKEIDKELRFGSKGTGRDEGRSQFVLAGFVFLCTSVQQQ